MRNHILESIELEMKYVSPNLANMHLSLEIAKIFMHALAYLIEW